jgi:hypothetical protein
MVSHLVGSLQFLCRVEQFVFRQRGEPADLAADRPHVGGRVGHIAGAGPAEYAEIEYAALPLFAAYCGIPQHIQADRSQYSLHVPR